MNGPPPELAGIWLHSHEEDTGSAMVFRPRTYAFPPARWRDAVELRGDGTCIWHGSSPDDRGQTVPSRWEDLGQGRAQITVPGAAGSLATHGVRSWSHDKLVIDK